MKITFFKNCLMNEEKNFFFKVKKKKKKKKKKLCERKGENNFHFSHKK